MRAVVQGGTPGEFLDGMKREIEITARASTATAKQLAAEIKQGGRGVIGIAGLSKKVQNAFRVNYYPVSTVSIEPSVFAYSAIKYFNIFAEGGTIKGHRGLMWISLPTIPRMSGGRRMTPRLFEQTVGPLQYFRRPGGRPLLMARALRKSRVGKRVALSTLRRGATAAKQGRTTNWVPAFVGIPSLTLRRRVNIDPVIEAALNRAQANFASLTESLSGQR